MKSNNLRLQSFLTLIRTYCLHLVDGTLLLMGLEKKEINKTELIRRLET